MANEHSRLIGISLTSLIVAAGKSFAATAAAFGVLNKINTEIILVCGNFKPLIPIPPPLPTHIHHFNLALPAVEQLQQRQQKLFGHGHVIWPKTFGQSIVEWSTRVN